MFARALPLGLSMSVTALRDHAAEMLDVIALDLDTPESPDEQEEKGKGLGPRERRAAASAAARHGYSRAESGFTVVQMVAEFRALRASVIHLWTQQAEHVGRTELDDLIRFNEAIDEAIAESLMRYSKEIDDTRQQFLAILGHDLRNPLGAIAMSSSFLLETGGLTPQQDQLVHGIENAERRMTRLVADLLELAMSRLGDSIPVVRSETDLGSVVRDVVAEVRASYPAARIETRIAGSLIGQWDAARLTQALTNLVGNAVQHGKPHGLVDVSATGDDREVTIAVHNDGAAIPAETMRRITEGTTAGTTDHRDRRHLGLGMVIVDRIVEGHGGTIDVQSTADAGTTFAVHLPRSAPQRDTADAPGSAPR